MWKTRISNGLIRNDKRCSRPIFVLIRHYLIASQTTQFLFWDVMIRKRAWPLWPMLPYMKTKISSDLIRSKKSLGCHVSVMQQWFISISSSANLMNRDFKSWTRETNIRWRTAVMKFRDDLAKAKQILNIN